MRTATLNIIGITLVALLILIISNLISLSSRKDTMELSMQNAIENSVKLLENKSLNFNDIYETSDEAKSFYSMYNKCILDAIENVLGLNEADITNKGYDPTIFTSISALSDDTIEIKGRTPSKDITKLMQTSGKIQGTNTQQELLKKIKNKALEYAFVTLLVENSINNVDYTVEFYGVSADDGYLHIKVTGESAAGLPNSEGKYPTQRVSIERAVIIVNKDNL